MKTLPVLLLISILFASCTEQVRSRKLGGEVRVELPAGQRLVTATWKDADLWYLIRPAIPDEPVQTYHFVESSQFGLLEGRVIFVER